MMEIGEAFTIDNKSFLKSFDSTFLEKYNTYQNN